MSRLRAQRGAAQKLEDQVWSRAARDWPAVLRVESSRVQCARQSSQSKRIGGGCGQHLLRHHHHLKRSLSHNACKLMRQSASMPCQSSHHRRPHDADSHRQVPAACQIPNTAADYPKKHKGIQSWYIAEQHILRQICRHCDHPVPETATDHQDDKEEAGRRSDRSVDAVAGLDWWRVAGR